MLSFGNLIVILIIILLLFGAGKVPQIMTDLAKGLRAFKDGLKNDSDKDLDK
jgi:sec-independent protein translocase protein TatA